MKISLNEKHKFQIRTIKNCCFYSKTTLSSLFFLALLLFFNSDANAQDSGYISPHELKNYSIEELMNLEVSLVSRTPQRLVEAASAVQVITAEAIRKSGAVNIAEALRLVANLQVAQLNANAWLISSRGFNTTFANKLLVMIDGRTVYTPLYGGVLWDMQNVLLEDIERIEVVSGPGGTLWGANAVNGVINIITKSAKDTRGLYISALAGTFIRDNAEIRYGGQIGRKINYRIFGQHFDRGSTMKSIGGKNNDAWRFTQGGFRLDWDDDTTNTYSILGNVYAGTIKTAGKFSNFNGQNALGKWKHIFSGASDLVFQMYYDRYFKASMPALSDEMNTADLDLQYRFPLGRRHNILSGLGYRLVRDNFVSQNSAVAILPQRKNLDLANVFVQDEITVSDRVKLVAGTKVLHNVYTGIEFQPGVRVSFAVNGTKSLWASASRSVRTPGRLDVDYYAPATPQPPTTGSIAGGPDFISEKNFAYELGYRMQPDSRSLFSISTFYNVYKDIYSLETLPGTLTRQAMNGTEGTSWGTEFAGTYQLRKNWRIRGGYTYFDMNLQAKPGHVFNPSYLANDVKHQALFQSMCDLPFNLHLDVTARYLDHLPLTFVTIRVPEYFTFDMRVAYTVKFMELALVGQNLYKKNHTEFSSINIPRSVYAKLTARF